ncbi:MAG: alanine--tRNA ligase [Clostridiales bacterium]|nr:alanine--tRNA ligase [Clostridiales bacterium]
MKWTGLNELREKYLSFFESKGHLRLKSFSLVPNNDKSLLLINSGMAPMKKFFTGEVTPPRNRVTTCQKCIRTPDLDRVGITARHGTYFEMLGNFSFGDYFKKEAIAWAWEFLTETLEMPKELLWPSVYEKDDEAYDLWKNMIGVPEERIVRLGKEDNFWEHGSGPCGPCSEIYFDRGEKYGCGSPDCKPGCDCDRYMEIWNNVFSQFNNDGNGNYTELAHKNIDTGMGLERLACVMQGVDNMFEVDTIRRILDKVCEVANKTYGANEKDDISIRVITDHIRSSVFMISDGILPSNEGRGYVLRRIIRRAARHSKLLGINHAFLSGLSEVVIQENKAGYPELSEKKDYIQKIISVEEEKFDSTIDTGLNILSGYMDEANNNGSKVIPGEDVFKLYDTFGFPIDLTREIAHEKGIQIDEDKFLELMKEQKERARNARANLSGWSNASKTFLSSLPKTEFTGYSENACDCKVFAIIDEDKELDEISEGEFSLVLDKTPFYAESGGQVGDSGNIVTDKATVSVIDTKKADGVFIHICKMESGTLCVGDRAKAIIDEKRRKAIARNHSSAHLLQAALREVLGTHVEQAGSYVDENYVRFDFTHFSAMTKEELAAVEEKVNEQILGALDVNTVETDIDSAKKMGAMALFGEKYGDTVRVVKMGDYSMELCGGTHVDNTSKLGLFKIVSESSVAAGVRRIFGITGTGVLSFIDEKQKLIESTAAELKAANPEDIAKRASQLQDEMRNLKHSLDELNEKLSSSDAKSLIDKAETVGNKRLLCAKVNMKADAMRNLCDKFKADYPDLVAVLASVSDGKINFAVSCGKDAVANGANAGKIVKEIATMCGGGGGGRPDSASAGGKDASKLDEALGKVKELI